MGRLIDADELERYIDNCDFCNRCPDASPRCQIDCEMPDFLTKRWKRVIDGQPTVDAILKDDNFGFAGYISKKDESGYRVEESWNLELNDEELMCIMCGVIQDLKKHKRLNKLWMKAVDLADFIGEEYETD